MSNKSQWYIRKNEKTHGPFTSRELKNLVEKSLVTTETQVRRADVEKWVPAQKIKGLFIENLLPATIVDVGSKDTTHVGRESSNSSKKNSIQNVSPSLISLNRLWDTMWFKCVVGCTLFLFLYVVINSNSSEQITNANTQYKLGLKYFKGDGVVQDRNVAFKWYQKAADQGHSDAQNNLSVLYEHGVGVRKDLSEAIFWLKKSAKQGNTAAEHNLGNKYYNGDNIVQDKSRAAILFRKAAEKGFAESQFNLGIMYNYGEGLKQDNTQAVKWYRKAAEQGQAQAQFNLGNMYYKGEGVKQDRNQAVKWLRKSANQGVEPANQLLDILLIKNTLEKIP